MLNIEKLDEVRNKLNTLAEVKTKLERLDRILGTDRNLDTKRNINGFLVSPELYYSIYEQIKSEYRAFYMSLKSQVEE